MRPFWATRVAGKNVKKYAIGMLLCKFLTFQINYQIQIVLFASDCLQILHHVIMSASENGSIDDDERSSGYDSDQEYDLCEALMDGEDDGEDEDEDEIDDEVVEEEESAGKGEDADDSSQQSSSHGTTSSPTTRSMTSSITGVVSAATLMSRVSKGPKGSLTTKQKNGRGISSKAELKNKAVTLLLRQAYNHKEGRAALAKVLQSSSIHWYSSHFH